MFEAGLSFAAAMEFCLCSAAACEAAACAFVAAVWAVDAAVLMAPPSRLAVFLLHFTVSLLNTELANPPRLELAPECLPGLTVCGPGGTG